MKRKSLLFLSLDWYRSKDPKVPLAMASIEAFAKTHYDGPIELNFCSFDLNNSSFNIEKVLRSIHRTQPDFLAIGVYIWNEQEVQDILSFVRTEYQNIEIILGGPQVTFDSGDLGSSYPGAKYFVKGSGEIPFVEILKQLEEPSPNFEHLNEFGVSIAGERAAKPFRCELNNLVSPYLSSTIPIEPGQEFIRWETIRGCPYKCSFCHFREEDGRVSYSNTNRLRQEIELFALKGVKQIAILDPVFNLKSSHYLYILEEIEKSGLRANLSLQCRLELLTKPHGLQLLEFCKRYKNVTLEFGVQTFQEKESKAVQRNNRFEEIDRALELLHDYEVDFELHLIFGLPYQTFESFQASMEKAMRSNPSGLYVFPLNVLKGTNILEKVVEWEYEYEPSDYGLFTSSKWMDADEVRKIKEYSNQVNDLSKLRKTGQHVVYPRFAT